MATKKKAAAQLPLAAEPIPAPSPGARLYVHRLHAKGFAGIPGEMVIDFASDVTVLQGENASRKSSVLAALRCVLGIDRMAAGRRAHIDPADGSLLKPELEVRLQGEDREVHVRRVGDGSPEVRERDGEDWRVVPRPVEWLRELVDAQGAVPEGFIKAKDDDRATMLLEALELPGYSRAAALEAAGLQGFRLPPLPEGLHPLEDLEKVMDAVFNSRTEVNRQRDSERDAAAKLLAGLPAEPPKDVAAVVAAGDREATRLADAVARETEAAEADLRLAQERISGTFRAEAAKLRAAAEAEVAEIRAEAERRSAKLLAALEATVATVKAKGEAELETAHATRQEAIQALEAKRADLAAGREKLAALREAQRAAETDRHVRATAEEGKAKAAALDLRSGQLTAGIQGLRRYAVELAGSLPIRGLEVRYDEKGRRVITLDRIPLEQVNDGRMRELADEISLLHAAARGTDRPYLPLILIDWLEQVDEVRRVEHLVSLAGRGAQVIAAVVVKGPLRVLHGAAALGGEAA